MAGDATECQDYQSVRPASDATGVSSKKGFTQPGNNLYKPVCHTLSLAFWHFSQTLPELITLFVLCL